MIEPIATTLGIIFEDLVVTIGTCWPLRFERGAVLSLPSTVIQSKRHQEPDCSFPPQTVCTKTIIAFRYVIKELGIGD